MRWPLPLRHEKPHLVADVCACSCRRCVLRVESVGKTLLAEVCVCSMCSARKCGRHEGVPRSPRPFPVSYYQQ